MNVLTGRLKDARVAAALGFVAGLIVGLPVLGWWLWPVEYVGPEPAVGVTEPAATDQGSTEDASAPRSSVAAGLGRALMIGGLAVVGLLVAGAAVFVWRVRSGSRAEGMAAGSTTRPRSMPVEREPSVPELFSSASSALAPASELPIQQFMTTYMLGDDSYDDSFSIDAPSGAFLGECGVGISEAIGVGEPKKPTAFEVWLFDKNDIRTVTKVLMSEHAHRDEALRSRLAAKGEPVLARAGETMRLETASLRVTARVVDMGYGGGALPPNSFFERLTIELAAWAK